LDKNRMLYIIDLGTGFTPGMYRPEAETNFMQGNINAREMLYMLGRTVWQLWDDEFSPELLVPAEGALPPAIDEMVQAFCSNEIDSTSRVVDMWEKYRFILEHAVEEAV